MNIEQIRQRLSEFKDTNDQSNIGLLYKSAAFPSKPKGLTFCDKLDLMSLGLQRGTIENFRFEI